MGAGQLWAKSEAALKHQGHVRLSSHEGPEIQPALTWDVSWPNRVCRARPLGSMPRQWVAVASVCTTWKVID